LKTKKLSCHSTFQSGEVIKPEMDDFKWVKKAELGDLLLNSQKGIINYL
jgi:hypothetical protein